MNLSMFYFMKLLLLMLMIVSCSAEYKPQEKMELTGFYAQVLKQALDDFDAYLLSDGEPVCIYQSTYASGLLGECLAQSWIFRENEFKKLDTLWWRNISIDTFKIQKLLPRIDFCGATNPSMTSKKVFGLSPPLILNDSLYAVVLDRFDDAHKDIIAGWVYLYKKAPDGTFIAVKRKVHE